MRARVCERGLYRAILGLGIATDARVRACNFDDSDVLP